MPYVTRQVREDLLVREAITPGELNYEITMLCKDYLRNRGENYHTYNDIIGAIECAKLEWYRRMVTPYEDLKIKENGDV